MSAATAWMDDAACTTTDPDAFHPEKAGGNNRNIRRICDACPVAEACLEWAITNTTDGIYAGTTPRQRATIRAEREAA